MREYGSAANKRNQLDVYDMTDINHTLIITLNHANTVDVSSCRTELFDTPNELVQFIENKEKLSNYLFFEARAYEIINEHYIKLYFKSIVSNA